MLLVVWVVVIVCEIVKGLRNMQMKLFDKYVEVKDISCGMNGNPGHPYSDTRINVYTCLTHICNTNCSFCNYHYNDSVKFDFEKWEMTLVKLLSKISYEVYLWHMLILWINQSWGGISIITCMISVLETIVWAMVLNWCKRKWIIRV